MAVIEKVEVIWFIYGIWIKNRFIGIRKFAGRGKEASVDFNWKRGLNPFVLGWMHTHPGSYGCNPSSTDDKTMRSWVRGLGRPMISVIKCGRETVWYLYYRAFEGDWTKTPDGDIGTVYLRGHFKGIFAYGRK
jgi:hypothetical protein